MQQGRYAAKAVRAPHAGPRRAALPIITTKATWRQLAAPRPSRTSRASSSAAFPAWMTWLVVHLFYLVGFQNRLLVLIRWSFSFATRGRGARLITSPGDAAMTQVSGWSVPSRQEHAHLQRLPALPRPVRRTAGRIKRSHRERAADDHPLARRSRAISPPSRCGSRSPRSRSPTSTAPRRSTCASAGALTSTTSSPSRSARCSSRRPARQPRSSSLPGGATQPLQRLLLIVDDIEAARAELAGRGIDVSEIWHAGPARPPEPGRDPDGGSYLSHATFSDPDGHQWVLQEITERLPGRVSTMALSKPAPSSCTRPPGGTARSRPSPRRTTGGTGTRRTWAPARSGALLGRCLRGRRPLHGGGQARRPGRLTAGSRARNTPHAR